MALWEFRCIDNSGFVQVFDVKAKDKTMAIKKAMEKARKNAKGDISPTWNCKLIHA